MAATSMQLTANMNNNNNNTSGGGAAGAGGPFPIFNNNHIYNATNTNVAKDKRYADLSSGGTISSSSNSSSSNSIDPCSPPPENGK